MSSEKKVVIIAGPNGAGKTTFVAEPASTSEYAEGVEHHSPGLPRLRGYPGRQKQFHSTPKGLRSGPLS
jgi:tRNA A37 threonylcarbamoyladenosine biosynthesis protein TsaE